MGENWQYEVLLGLKEEMQSVVEFNDDMKLPEDIFVFLGYQGGHTFFYFSTDNDDDDPAVYKYHETKSPVLIETSLTRYFEAQIQR